MADLAREPKAKRNRPKNRKNDEQKLITDGPSPREHTKAIFNQLLQQAVQESGTDKTGKKKKKRDDALLEKIKKGEGLVKDEEDKTLIANTYDPDNDSKAKSNKRLQHEQEKKKSQEGTENLAFEDETTTKKEKKPKKKQTSEVISDLAPEPKAKVTQRVENLNTSNTLEEPIAAPRKKKKKKLVDDQDQADSHEQPAVKYQSEDALLPEEQDKARPKKKKKKKKSTEETERERVVEDDGRVLGVYVHRTDKLKTDFYMSHPMVRISCVDATTGNHVKKQTKDRPVSSYYEQQNDNVDFILPIMTQPYDFKERKSTLPVWEEMVIFNENFNYLLTESPPVILFFELLDFVSMNTAKVKYNTQKQDGGWHRIAWAFLKVLGANGHPNTERKVRLQLYQLPRLKAKADTLEIFQWYQDKSKIAYPSTLYVTLKGIVPPSSVQPAVRSMFATQKEQAGKTYDDLQDTLDRATMRKTNTRRRDPSPWMRLPGQVCKVPNEACLTLSSGRKGCYFIQFSPDGHFLACGCKENETYPIMVYEMPGGRLKGTFPGHYNIIYELCWSKDSKFIVSASSDGTAKIWNFEQFNISPEKILPHPSFVYAAKFHNHMPKVVVTGGYDHVIRVWSTYSDDDHALLMQELDGHLSNINSVCFDDDGAKMYSGDGLGHIIIWNVYVTEQPSKRGILKDWTKNKEIKENEFKGIAINYLKVHPNNRRLLVHTRDNTIRLIDLRIDAVMQRYQGALNYKEKICSTITPCGTFVITGSEDCNLYVWNTETGDQVAMFADLKYSKPVTCVDYHPHDHMMALCAFGDNEPVVVYRYSHQVAKVEAGLVDPSELKKTGRPGSPHMWTIVEQAMNQKLETDRSRTANVTEDIRARTLARMDRVTKKLDSVMAFRSMRPGSPGDHPLGVHGGGTTMLGTSTMATTWGTTFDTAYYTQFDRAMAIKQSSPGALSPPPGVFSPHATGSLQRKQHQQQLASQADFMRQASSSGTWRPLFSTVGRPRAVSPIMMAHQPTISLNTTMPGRAQFQFQAAEGSKDQAVEQVVALYDYAAQRSDELSMRRGEVIRVLLKDNDNWWMGELTNGQQGFFPANYVATADEETQDPYDSTGTDDVDQVLSDKTSTKRKTHAVTSKSGELKFVSGTEDSEDDASPRKGKRKGKKKKSQMTVSEENEIEMYQVNAKRNKRRSVAESQA